MIGEPEKNAGNSTLTAAWISFAGVTVAAGIGLVAAYIAAHPQTTSTTKPSRLTAARNERREELAKDKKAKGAEVAQLGTKSEAGAGPRVSRPNEAKGSEIASR